MKATSNKKEAVTGIRINKKYKIPAKRKSKNERAKILKKEERGQQRSC